MDNGYCLGHQGEFTLPHLRGLMLPALPASIACRPTSLTCHTQREGRQHPDDSPWCMTPSPRPQPQRDSRARSVLPWPPTRDVKTPPWTARTAVIQTPLAAQEDMGRAVISALGRGCVTLGARRMCSRTRALSECPDWRVSSVAVVPIKISWLTIPLACEPRGRGLVTSSASRFGQGPRSWPQRVFPDRRPPPPTCLQGCAPNPSPVCAFSFPRLHCGTPFLLTLLTRSRPPETIVRFRIESFAWLAFLF